MTLKNVMQTTRTHTQKDTKQHQQHQSTNPLECTFIIFASHFSSAIYRCDAIDRRREMLYCSWGTRTVKSLIGYLILERKKRMLKWCSSSSSSNRQCSRDWNTNFSMHSSQFNYSFMNGSFGLDDATFNHFHSLSFIGESHCINGRVQRNQI